MKKVIASKGTSTAKKTSTAKNAKASIATATPAKVAKPKAEKVEKPKVEKVEKPAGPIVSILSALYGIEGTRVEMTGLIKSGRKLTNKLAGSDPAPKSKKDAIITFTVDGGAEQTLTFAEGEVIALV